MRFKFTNLAVLVFTLFLVYNLSAQNADFSRYKNNVDSRVQAELDLLTTATWSTLPTSPHAVSRSCCAFVNRNNIDYVYQFGGGAGAQFTNVALFNVTSNSWTNNISTMPNEISAGTAIAFGDSVVYVIGGNSASVLGKCLKYNIAGNSWTVMADMPSPVTDAFCGKYQDSLIYVICGGDGLFGAVTSNAVRLYNVKTNIWQSLSTFPLSKTMCGGGIYKDTILVVSGWDGLTGTATCHKGVINPLNPTQVTWTALPNYPTGGVTRMASSVNLKIGQGVGIACTGGAIDGATLTAATNFWNFCTQSWQTLPVNSQPRSNLKGTTAYDSVMYIVGGFTTVGVGTFEKLTFSQIDGNCAESPRMLNPFNIQTPIAGARIVTVVGSSTPVSITWDTSGGGASYRFIFGNPVVPPRRFSIQSGSNSINTTLGALDAILAANGFTNNGSATDSAVGQWDVWAYKGFGAPGPDSLKATNGPRALTLRRQQVFLTPFTLSSPASGVTIVTSPIDLTLIHFIWTRSGQGSTYRWLYKTGGSYTDPATLRFPGNNGGLDSMWSVRNSRLDSILAGIGVSAGDSISGFWRARAFSTTDSLNSTAPDRAITFRRAGLLPLNQDFVDATFPPLFWGLDNGGGTTQYWTRNAVGGYQTGVGSAKYDFWTAQSTTPLQTLTSNQFPAVSSPTNYLRFNYSHAFYLAGGILANDSCIIETSTNNGSTWTRLIGMGASQTLSLGYNSTPIMTTVGGPVPGAFTPTAANQWATKIYVMPVGTNKVRFVAKSDFGNNLYIDNITSGTATGTGTPISLIPDRYELQQNYPNPFNPMTKINFSIPKQSQVTVRVYDMLGKEVAQLVNEMKTPGNYSIDFNGANFSSGVYFYKIEAGEFVDVKRMMLIK